MIYCKSPNKSLSFAIASCVTWNSDQVFGGAPRGVRGAPPAGLRRGQSVLKKIKWMPYIRMSFRSSSFIRNIYRNAEHKLKHVTYMSRRDNGGNSNRVWWKTWWVTMQQGGDNLLLVACANELQLKSTCNADGYQREMVNRDWRGAGTHRLKFCFVQPELYIHYINNIT